MFLSFNYNSQTVATSLVLWRVFMIRFYVTEVVIDFRLNLMYFLRREVKREGFCDLKGLVRRKLLLQTTLS